MLRLAAMLISNRPITSTAACAENTRNLIERVVREPRGIREGQTAVRCPYVRGYTA